MTPMSLLGAPRDTTRAAGVRPGLLTDELTGRLAPWLRRRAGGWRGVDAATALVVLLLLAVEIWAGNDLAPRPALTAAAAVAAAPLAWRAALPGPAAVVGAGGLLLTSLVSAGPLTPQLTILPVLVLLYGAGARLKGAAAAVLAAVTAGLVVAAHVVTPHGDATDFWPWLLWGGAWLSGTFVRRRTETAVGHATRAALLEARAPEMAREAATQERDRIARELHDVVAHAVSLMVVQAGAERLRLGAVATSEGEETRRALAAIEDTGRRALTELRTMLGVLRDADAARDEGLTPVPGLGELPALVARLEDAGLAVTLAAEPETLVRGPARLPGASEVAAHRIVQEALTNVLRHAGRTGVHVDLRLVPDGLRVEIADDGPRGDLVGSGSSPDPLGGGSGRGLAGMRERASAVGGTLEAGPRPTGGFRVLALLPADELRTGS